MVQVFFRKLFAKAEHGVFPSAIIGYQKQDVYFTSRTLSPEEARFAGFQVHGWPVRRVHFLRIDLWFAIFDFEFEQGNLKEPPLKPKVV